ncbi:hypothetical protein D3C72_1510770 [compost metagenome]
MLTRPVHKPGIPFRTVTVADPVMSVGSAEHCASPIELSVYVLSAVTLVTLNICGLVLVVTVVGVVPSVYVKFQGGVPVKAILKVAVPPLQIVCVGPITAVGFGLTFIVTTCGSPTHPFAVGVTV